MTEFNATPEFNAVSTEELNQIDGGFPSLSDIGHALAGVAEKVAVAVITAVIVKKL